MNCKYCGGELSLEAENCPHCGRINIHGQKHARDMQRYARDYASAEQKVYATAKEYTKVSVRMIILAIIIVLIGIVWAVIFASSDVMRLFAKVDSNVRVGEYTAKLDQCLEEEDYLAFNDLAYAYGLSPYYTAYDNEKYEEYEHYIRKSQFYGDVVTNALKAIEEEETLTSYSMQNMIEGLECFYTYDYNMQYALEKMTAEEREKYEHVVEGMETDISLLLQEYYHLTEEEVAQLSEDLNPGMRRKIVFEGWKRGTV